MMKTLVITPIQEEIDFFLQGCAEQGVQAEMLTLGRLPMVHFPALNLWVAQGGLGKTQFAVQTQYLLDTCPDVGLVICAGAAGALAGHLAIGDVVVGTGSVEHDIHNHFGTPLVPRFPANQSVITTFEQMKRVDPSFHVYFGAIASGDEDVVDVARGQAISKLTGALAVAWEGAGGARACRFSGVPFVEIRGITDNADHSAAADFAVNLRCALRNVAHLIIAWAGQNKRSYEKGRP
jgi:adenosylhomocysteine nucleosidase